MALSKTFAMNQILTANDVNTHMVHHVPNPGDPYDTGWIPLTPETNFQLMYSASVRRIGLVLYFKGAVRGNFSANVTMPVANSGFPNPGFGTSAAATNNNTGVYLYLSNTGLISIRYPQTQNATVWLHELSGSLAE